LRGEEKAPSAERKALRAGEFLSRLKPRPTNSKGGPAAHTNKSNGPAEESRPFLFLNVRTGRKTI
jgi:hypothetical protein